MGVRTNEPYTHSAIRGDTRHEVTVVVHDRRLLTLPETAAELRYSERTVRRLIDAGELRAVQFGRGRALRIPRTEIERLLNPSVPEENPR